MRCTLLAYAVVFVTAGGVNIAHALPVQSGADDAFPVVQTQSGSIQQQRLRAQAFYRTDKFVEAATCWKRIVNNGSNQASDHYWLAESYYQIGKYPEAAAEFREATKLDRKMDQAKVRMVEAYIASRNMPEAENACLAGLSMVNDPYARKQLEEMHKFTCKRELTFPTFKHSDKTESPNNGMK